MHLTAAHWPRCYRVHCEELGEVSGPAICPGVFSHSTPQVIDRAKQQRAGISSNKPFGKDLGGGGGNRWLSGRLE